MSTRYGISVAVDPAFAAGLHRARQLVCSQYGCWAAEMHSVHLPLTDYFHCPETGVVSLDARLELVAADFRERHSGTRALRLDALVEDEERRDIYVGFGGAVEDTEEPPAVGQLRSQLEAALAGLNPALNAGFCPLRFALLQNADLPLRVFESAARFAQGVVNGLELAPSVELSELVIFRYESDAAGDNWAGGGWATDLRWQIIDSFPLSTPRV